LLTLLLVSVFALSGTNQRAEAKLFDLQDFSAKQQANVWDQVDHYAFGAALLEYCRRPPNLEARALAVARECVTERSINAVVERFRAQVRAESGKWDCADPKIKQFMLRFERRIEKQISAARLACRFRSLY
jgi:hypothetical protein